MTLQEDYDNSGLLVGDPQREVGRALLCVDITEAVLDEAIELGAGIILAHHPVIFHPLRHITGGTYIERVVERAIKNDIALYAAHTNLDSTRGGLSHYLAGLFSLRQPQVLSLTGEDVGFGIVGELADARPTADFLAEVKTRLGIGALRHSDIFHPTIRRVAISSGSGSSLIPQAKASGAQLFLSADFRYNDFLDAGRDVIIADIGHFESEYCAIDILFDVIRKKMPNFALHRSVNSINPVNYLI